MDVTNLHRIERLNYVLGGVLVVAAAVFTPQEQALGILVGVVLGGLNFTLILRIVEKWLSKAESDDQNSGKKAASGFFLIPKMGALMAAVFLAMKFLPISPGALAVGFSTFLLSIIIETMRSLTNPPSDAESDGDQT